MVRDQCYGHGGDVYRNEVRYDFSANINPLGTPELVRQAVARSADSVAAYPDPYCTRLRAALGERLHVPESWLICGNGAAELIYQFVGGLHPGKVLLPVPSFLEYEDALRAFGVEPELFFLRREEGFSLSEEILEQIREDTSALILCNPNNPTGVLIPPALLERILERCRATGTWLFLDECFYDLTDEERAYTLLPRLEPGDRVFLLRAFTKLYGMAGLRLGYGICPREAFLDEMCRLVQPWNVSTPAQMAGLAALECQSFARESRAVIRREKEFLCRELAGLGMDVLPGKANYLMLRGPKDLYDRLLERGILIRSCENYRGLSNRDFRIAVRSRGENEALLRVLRSLGE